MDKSKKKNLQRAGWKVGSGQEFLGLSDDESKLIELRLALATGLKDRRIEKRMTQHESADLLETSKSRVAKMEAADTRSPSISSSNRCSSSESPAANCDGSSPGRFQPPEG